VKCGVHVFSEGVSIKVIDYGLGFSEEALKNLFKKEIMLYLSYPLITDSFRFLVEFFMSGLSFLSGGNYSTKDWPTQISHYFIK